MMSRFRCNGALGLPAFTISASATTRMKRFSWFVLIVGLLIIASLSGNAGRDPQITDRDGDARSNNPGGYRDRNA